MGKIKVCSVCGQPVYSLKALEERLGKPLLYLIECYEKWKLLREMEKEGERREICDGQSNSNS